MGKPYKGMRALCKVTMQSHTSRSALLELRRIIIPRSNNKCRILLVETPGSTLAPAIGANVGHRNIVSNCQAKGELVSIT